MTLPRDDEPDRSPVTPDALAEATTELRDEQPPAEGEPADRYWLRVGIGLGLRQPGRAKLLLSELEAARAGSPQADEGAGEGHMAGKQEAAAVVTGAASHDPAGNAPSDPVVGESDDEPAASRDEDTEPQVPVRSRILARSAALPKAADADTVFGWVLQLTPTEVRRLGQAVGEMLGAGGMRDLDRAFALAWSGSAHLPSDDLKHLFGRFAELELAVCSVLGGRDIRDLGSAPSSGVDSIFSFFMKRPNPANMEIDVILKREGDAGRRGLIAIWNAWSAIRFRDVVPPALFEQLTRPWVVVVGALPNT